jgi:D-alanine-D-alanine ligase
MRTMYTVGLTYDLKEDYLRRGFDAESVAELDKPETIGAIEQTLQQLGYRTDRVGSLPDLVERLHRGQRWDLVFNISEGLHGYGRESQVPALLDAYQIPYTFSDPLTLAVTLHKATAKRVVRDQGVPTPDFVVVDSVDDARRVSLPLPLFAKPVAEGSSKGISERSAIRRRKDLVPVCEEILRQQQQPVLVETFLPGREFTVGVLGTGGEAFALGVMEIRLRKPRAKSYSLTIKSSADYRAYVDYRLCSDAQLALECERVALAAWRGLGCRDAGRVDLRCDAAGQPMFMEVNPLAGLHPVDSDLIILADLLGVSYREVITRIMASAEARSGLSVPIPRVARMR